MQSFERAAAGAAAESWSPFSRPPVKNPSLLPIRPIAGHGAARIRVGRSHSDNEVGSPSMYIGGGFVVLVLIIIVVVLLLRR